MSRNSPNADGMTLACYWLQEQQMRIPAFVTSLSFCVVCLAAGPAVAATITWGTTATAFNNEVTGEDFAALYGGSLVGGFPLPFATVAAAEAAVLGVPDDTFLTLPGTDPSDPIANIDQSDWVAVGFGSTFDRWTRLHLVEVGDNAESAWVGVWNPAQNSAFIISPVLTRGADDHLIVDLSPYVGLWNAIGGVGGYALVYGADVLGASAGFDLDAVGIEAIPEPATLLLLGTGLAAAGVRRRMKKRS